MRETLTEWPTELPEGVWAYNTSSGLVTDGEFRTGSDGTILFESILTGSNWWPCGFEVGETFVPVDDDGEPEIDHFEPIEDPETTTLRASLSALEAENEHLRQSLASLGIAHDVAVQHIGKLGSEVAELRRRLAAVLAVAGVADKVEFRLDDLNANLSSLASAGGSGPYVDELMAEHAKLTAALAPKVTP